MAELPVIIMTQLSPEELSQLIEDSVRKALMVSPKQNIDSETVLNVSEAAKLLNLGVQTVYVKVSKKEIPFLKQGKRLYFYRSELLKYLNEGRKIYPI